MPINTIFEGTTISPARDFAADVALFVQPSKVYMPCVGRFGALAALVEKGYKPDKIHASDLSLYSSIIGYLCDNDKDLFDLALDDRPLQKFLPSSYDGDPFTYAAASMLAMKYMQVQPIRQYEANLRRELRYNADSYRDHVEEKLRALAARISGIHYEVADVWDVAEEHVRADGSFMYINLPGYRKGYTKMFGGPEEQFGWSQLAINEFAPESTEPFLETCYDTDNVTLAYVPHGLDRVPVGWKPVFAFPQNEERTDYMVTNGQVDLRYAHMKLSDARPVPFEIYDDQEITEDSEIRFVHVDAVTALYYRDLFVHRLGMTQAEFYFLMLIDGRVVSACGINDQHLNHGKSEYISEVFGISRTSARYARLGKLFMLALTCRDMQLTLMRARRSMQFRTPKGVQTTSITKHREGKTDRSVMKRVSVEDHPAGYRIVYKADFRPETFSEVVRYWLGKWGNKSRPGYEGRTENSESGKEGTVG